MRNEITLRLYRSYINLLSLPFSLILFTIQWKKPTVTTNLKLCGYSSSSFSFFRFYFHISRDFFLFLHGRSIENFFLRSRDIPKFNSLKATGGILLTAHFHNWELMGSWLRENGLALLSYAKPLANPFWNAVLNFLRKRISLPIVSQNTLKTAVKWIKNGKTFGFLWDQRADSEKVIIPFFKQKISVSQLPTFLAKTTKKPCYIFFLLPDFSVRILQISHLNSNFYSEKILTRYHKILEMIIQKHPEFWYGWAHRRFKLKTRNPYNRGNCFT